MPEKRTVPNRLINETSPYLLQHAYNPVDWWPWCGEAFEKAEIENKLVFLSIGYSTCHWCHVMERESFEDNEVAVFLNDNYIPVKVDREERPDIDSVYMNVCQAMNGTGGWPLTIIMTPDKKPFFAGTYFPKHKKRGSPGLMGILTNITSAWESDPDKITGAAQNITDELRGIYGSPGYTGKSQEESDVVEKAFYILSKNFDSEYGGFGDAPKFPSPHNLMFLHTCHRCGIGPAALEMSEKTLLSMYMGGIYDHAGYGFSRYSTDKRWFAPHFEKMLYDNAMLCISYTEAFHITGNQFYGYVAERIIEYMERELASPDGAFYSAQDADSEGGEGLYYIWSYDEVISILGKEKGASFCRKYNITKAGNFEGSNILNLIGSEKPGIPDDNDLICLDMLLQARPERYELHRDDKIILSWNALTAVALARAGRIFDNKIYIEKAVKTIDFINTCMTSGGGRLHTSFKNGILKGMGVLDDYAYLIWACIELYDATLDVSFLERSIMLYNIINNFFSDRENGGFYLTAEDSEKLIYRPREFYDGALPSGNSVIAHCIQRLYNLTGDKKWSDAFDLQMKGFSGITRQQPSACTFALRALLDMSYPKKRVVCVLKDISVFDEMKHLINTQSPHEFDLIAVTPDNIQKMTGIIPGLNGYKTNENPCAFYVCGNNSCLPPVYSVDELKKLI